MRTSKLYLLVFLLNSFLPGCSSDTFFGEPVYEKKLNGNYYLDATDEYEEMAIGIDIDGEGVGVIEATVFAVGQNENFIIAKQHPLSSPGAIDKHTTNYFIIPLNMKVSKSIDKNYFGPLAIKEFEQRKRELKINRLPFSIFFKELD